MRIEVEPDTLIGAGQQMGSLGSQLGMLSGALGAALGNGIASGTDAAGLNFGLKYGHQAEDFGNALADAANAFKTVGYLLAATGHNYQNADAASTIGGSGPSGGVGGEPSKTVAGSAPEGPNGATVPPPGSWYLVQPLLQALPGFGLFAGTAMTWPSGKSAMMQVTAAQWRNFATGLAVFEPQLGAVKSAVSAQSIPESAKIVSALNDLGQAVKSLADVASSVAQSISDFAVGVQETQDAIRRLLDRLSIGGLWDTVTGFLTGEGDDILREIANDVSTALGNFQRQVKGIVGLLEELVTLIGEAADAFQKWIRPVLIAQFGEDVGGFLAGAVTLYTDFEVGLATGLINTVSGVVSLADADTWKGMAELAVSVAQDPSTLPGVLKNMGKEFVAWDKWSGDHPGRAAGEAAFNIGSLFVPGGAFSKTGSVAKGLNVTRRMLDEGRLPQLGEVGGWSRGAPKLDGVGTNVPKVPEIPSVEPGTVPSLPKLDSPNGATPGRVGEPAPTSPSGKSPTAGAEGGPGQRAPVDQPGRAPVDQPGRAPTDAGSRSGSSASAHPSSPNGHPSPAAAHAPESSSLSTTHDGDGAVSGPGESPSNHGTGTSESPHPARADELAPVATGNHSADTAATAGGETRGTVDAGEGHGSGTRGSGGDGSASPSSVDNHGRGPDDSKSPGRHDDIPHRPGDDSFEKDDAGTSDSGSSTSNGGDGGRAHPIRSDEPSGDGWHRLDGDETDPTYGHQSLDQHWTYGDYPTEIHQSVRDLISDPEAPWGRDSTGDPLTQDQYESLYNKEGPDGEHWQNWPPNAGAVPHTRLIYDELDAFVRDFGMGDTGVGVDRIGRLEGDYLAVMPDGVAATFEDRSLPIYSLTQPYHQFALSGNLPEGWSIEVSEVAPAFGREGGGIQVRILDSDGAAVLIPQLKLIGLLR